MSLSCLPRLAVLVAGGGRAERSPELVTRVDRKLPIDVAQVVLDCLRAEEQGGRGFARRAPVGQQQRHLQLLGRQLAETARVAAAGGLAGRSQFCAGELAPWTRCESVERLD